MSTTNVLRFCNEDNCIIVGPDCGAEIPTTILERLNGVVVTQKNGLVNPLNIKPSWAYGDAVLKVGSTVVDLENVHGIFRRNGFVNTHDKYVYQCTRINSKSATWNSSGLYYTADFSLPVGYSASYYNGGFVAILSSATSTTSYTLTTNPKYYSSTAIVDNGTSVTARMYYTKRPTTYTRYMHLFGIRYETVSSNGYKEIGSHTLQYGNFKERNYDGSAWSTSCGTALSVLNNGTAVTSGYVPDSSSSTEIGYIDTIGGVTQDNTFGFMCPTDKCVVCDKIYKNGLRISETVLKHEGGYYG